MATNDESIFLKVSEVIKILAPLPHKDQVRVLAAVRPILNLPESGEQEYRQDERELDKARGSSGNGASGGKRTSLAEFVNAKQPATHQQRIAVFAAYREEHEGHEYFGRADLEAYFEKAKIGSPGEKYAREYNKAVKEGWIEDNNDKSYLTETGRKAVQAGFGGKAKPRGKSVKRPKKQ